MFCDIHLDILPLMFDYLTQEDLLKLILMNRTLYQKIMKYVDERIYKIVKDDDPENLKWIRECYHWQINKLKNKSLRYAASLNLILSIRLIKNKASYDWDYGLEGACRGGHRDLAELMIQKGAIHFQQGFLGACRGGQLEFVQWMYREINIENLQCGFVRACRRGHMDIVKWLIEKSSSCFSVNRHFYDRGLYKASIGNHRAIIDLMIQNGANNWDDGLEGACTGGNRELAEWMIEKGANDWNSALTASCQARRADFCKWMIEKGASRCYHCGHHGDVQPGSHQN